MKRGTSSSSGTTCRTIVEDSKEFGTTFDPFFVFSFVPDAAEDDIADGWPTEPVALHFLHHEVESAPDIHREFIEQACKSPASFFVVESVQPGRALDLKDILTGRRFHVLEQSASRTLQAGDVTFTRVVTAGGGSIMIGACPWVIPASWHIPLIDMREKFRPKRSADAGGTGSTTTWRSVRRTTRLSTRCCTPAARAAEHRRRSAGVDDADVRARRSRRPRPSNA